MELLNFDAICKELGLKPQFLFELSRAASQFYSSFETKKRSGGRRLISASEGELKRIQRVILRRLLSKKEMPLYLHGCIQGRSIATNASMHVRKKCILNIDLKDFFGTIGFDSVKEVFQVRFSADDEASEILARLTTLNGFLPQGAPSSPSLANLAAMPLDEEIIRICSENLGEGKFDYSRYVDDVTISGDVDLTDLVSDLYAAIERTGFIANQKKTKILRPCNQQKVTGVVVNRKMNPPKKLLRRIRQQLYYCEKFGFEEHCKERNIHLLDFIKKLRGEISFVRITQPELSDYLSMTLGKGLYEWSRLAELERNVYLLSRLIADRKMVAFTYDEDEECKVAPIQLSFLNHTQIVLHGFQLSPVERWENYFLDQMTSLEPLNEPIDLRFLS